MAQRETAYQIIARQADRIRELEELVRFYEQQPSPETTTKAVPNKDTILPPFGNLMSPLLFLEKLFSEQREWTRDEITRRGRQAYKFTSDQIFQVAQPLFGKLIDVFAEYTEDGQKYFVWRAKPGWPYMPDVSNTHEDSDRS